MCGRAKSHRCPRPANPWSVQVQPELRGFWGPGREGQRKAGEPDLTGGIAQPRTPNPKPLVSGPTDAIIIYISITPQYRLIRVKETQQNRTDSAARPQVCQRALQAQPRSDIRFSRFLGHEAACNTSLRLGSPRKSGRLWGLEFEGPSSCRQPQAA